MSQIAMYSTTFLLPKPAWRNTNDFDSIWCITYSHYRLIASRPMSTLRTYESKGQQNGSNHEE